MTQIFLNRFSTFPFLCNYPKVFVNAAFYKLIYSEKQIFTKVLACTQYC